MATLDDITSLLNSAEAALAAGNGASAAAFARRALALAPILPNVIQQGADRIERQQIISGIKELIGQCNAETTAGRTSPMQFTKLVRKEVTS